MDPNQDSYCRRWLAQASRRSLGDFELTPTLDAELSAHALLARADPTARDALFACLAGKVERFSVRYQRWDLDPWSFDDVMQEAYLAFVATLHTWRPLSGPDGPTGFGRYFLAVFPRRLSDHVRRMTGRGCHSTLGNPDELLPDPLDFEQHVDTLLTLDAMSERLDARDGAIIYLRVVADAAPATIASATGLCQRTVRRRWSRVVPLLRERWAG